MKSTYTVPVEFGDTDPATIVFYPHFFRWFDASAWRLFAKAGLTLPVLQNDFGLVGLPIAEARSRFLRPARLGDILEVTSYVNGLSRKLFEVVHEVRNDGELIVEGVESRVCAKKSDAGVMRAITIPEPIRTRLEQLRA